MLNTLLAGTMIIAGVSAETPTVAMVQDLACQIYGGDDFTHFNITSIEKSGSDTYSKEQITWRFCDHLPGSYYFATKIDLMTGTTPLTSDRYEPDEVEVLLDVH